jgi:hypothetical protein
VRRQETGELSRSGSELEHGRLVGDPEGPP